MLETLRRAMANDAPRDHLDDPEIAAYLDGSLSNSERTRIERHLAACARCGEEFAACSQVEFQAAEADENASLSPVPSLRVGSGLRSRAPKRNRTWLPIAAGIALLLGAGYLGRETGTLLARQFEPALLDQLAAWTDRDVSAAGAALLLARGPGLQISDLAIAEDPSFGRSTFASARRVSLRASPLAFLSGRIDGSVEIDRPSLRLVRDTSGGWNIESIAGRAPREGSGSREVAADVRRAMRDAAEGLPPRNVPQNPRVRLAFAKIIDGRLEIEDRSRSDTPLRIDEVDLSYTGIRGQRGNLSFEGRVGPDRDRVSVRGVVGPFEGSAIPVYRLSQVSVKSLPIEGIPGAPAALDGNLSFSGNLQTAGRSLDTLLRSAQGTGSLELCCGSVSGRNLARDLLNQIASRPGAAKALTRALDDAALALLLEGRETSYDNLAGRARLDAGVLRMAGLEFESTLLRATAETSLALDGAISARGAVEFSPAMARVLVASLPALEGLVSDSGNLSLPFEARGSWKNLELEVDLPTVLSRLAGQEDPLFGTPIDLWSLLEPGRG